MGLGRGAVDFIRQQQVGEYRALAQLELLALQVIHGVAGDVAGHQIRGELDARELAAKAARQGTHQQGLAEAGNAFDQHMAAGDQGAEHVINHRRLADQGFLQFTTQCLSQLAGALALRIRVGSCSCRGSWCWGRYRRFGGRSFDGFSGDRG